MDSIQNNNVPQNFNNQSYNTPPQMNNKPPKSGLGIAALILSILGCTFIIGAILAIIDITKKDGKNKILSKISLGICGFWLLIGIVGSLGKKDNNDTSSSNSTEVTETTVAADTPEDQLNDLAIGDSVTIRGVTITVNSITDTETSSGSPAYEVSITYSNHSGKRISASPYDWSTVLHTGSDKAYVGGKGSFNTESISDGEEWTGVVTLWNDDNAEKIKFESSSLNLAQDKDLYATWLLPVDDEKEETTEESTEEKSGGAEEEYSEDNADIVVVAGELGDYGRSITLNANTDLSDERYLYKIPAGNYKVITTWEKLTSFGIVKDDNEIAIDPETNNEYMPHVGDDYFLTAGEDDFNGHAEKEVVITLGEDESIWIPYTKDSIATPGSIKFLFFKQE